MGNLNAYNANKRSFIAFSIAQLYTELLTLLCMALLILTQNSI